MGAPITIGFTAEELVQYTFLIFSSLNNVTTMRALSGLIVDGVLLGAITGVALAWLFVGSAPRKSESQSS